MIGLDTSHAPAFAELLNGPKADRRAGGRESRGRVSRRQPRPAGQRRSRRRATRRSLPRLGVEIVPSIDALLPKVDVVLLESVDGRPAPGAGHAGAARPRSRCSSTSRWPARWPTRWRFSSWPSNWTCPASPVRRCGSARASSACADDPQVGEVLGCEARGPCTLEPHHPDLFWYGIHGVETLFTIMGTGCEAVSRVQTDGTEFVVGRWNDGRIGTFRGLRDGAHGYGATVFGDKGIAPSGGYDGYRAAGGRDRQVLQDRQAAGQRRRDAGDLRLHGSRRREQAPGRSAGDDRKRAGQSPASGRRKESRP